jgi:hypothetical protein
VNTYDPMDRIVYRHLDTRHMDSTLLQVLPTVDVAQLPAGYANGSPRTYLGRARRLAQVADQLSAGAAALPR